MNWSNRVKQVRGWSRYDWILLIEAWMALLVARLAIRYWRFQKVLKRLQQTTHPSAERTATKPVVRAVQRAARLHPIPMRCLPQATALSWMLVRRGQPCEFVIGAKLESGTLDAHAWVEQDGIPINSPANSAEIHPVLLREAVGIGIRD